MLATICLFPVDIALVSTTVDRNVGLRKPWASLERVASIVFSLKIVYYSIPPLNEMVDGSLVWCGCAVLSSCYTVQLFLVRGMG